jgi:hypothetical protein
LDSAYFDAPGAMLARLGPSDSWASTASSSTSAAGEPAAALEALCSSRSSSVSDAPLVTVVFARAEGPSGRPLRERGGGGQEFAATSAALSRVLLAALRLVPGGYLCRQRPGDLKYMAAFASPQAALAWCLLVQATLERLPWRGPPPPTPGAATAGAAPAGAAGAAAAEPAGAAGTADAPPPLLPPVGLRLCMGAAQGVPQSILPDHLGRADYHAPFVNISSRYCECVSLPGGCAGGQIVTDAETALRALRDWSASGSGGGGGGGDIAAPSGGIQEEEPPGVGSTASAPELSAEAARALAVARARCVGDPSLEEPGLSASEIRALGAAIRLASAGGGGGGGGASGQASWPRGTPPSSSRNAPASSAAAASGEGAGASGSTAVAAAAALRSRVPTTAPVHVRPLQRQPLEGGPALPAAPPAAPPAPAPAPARAAMPPWQSLHGSGLGSGLGGVRSAAGLASAQEPLGAPTPAVLDVRSLGLFAFKGAPEPVEMVSVTALLGDDAAAALSAGGTAVADAAAAAHAAAAGAAVVPRGAKGSLLEPRSGLLERAEVRLPPLSAMAALLAAAPPSAPAPAPARRHTTPSAPQQRAAHDVDVEKG